MLPAFVSFKTQWGAAVCAQTQQTRNPTLWLTEWASEPRDVYWKNLAIPYVSLTVRRLVVAVTFFFLTFFFMIPIAFVQSMANIEGIEKKAPFLRPIIEVLQQIKVSLLQHQVKLLVIDSMAALVTGLTLPIFPLAALLVEKLVQKKYIPEPIRSQVVTENRILFNMVQDLKGNIRVYCRIRPTFSAEAKNVINSIEDDGSLVIQDPSKPEKGLNCI